MIYFSSKKSNYVNKPKWAQQEWEGGRAWSTVPFPTETAVSDVMLKGHGPGADAPLHTSLRHSHEKCGETWGGVKFRGNV